MTDCDKILLDVLRIIEHDILQAIQHSKSQHDLDAKLRDGPLAYIQSYQNEIEAKENDEALIAEIEGAMIASSSQGKVSSGIARDIFNAIRDAGRLSK
jgi:hypothetical protein